jgi:GPI-anchor transamidase subunit T
MNSICPLSSADTPPVCLEIPESRNVFISDGVFERKNADDRSRCYFVQPDATLEMIMPYEETPTEGEAGYDGVQRKQLVDAELPPLYAERSFTGHGQERGGVQTILTNPSPDREVEFVFMQSLPWFMRIYLHTLEARIDGHEGAHPKLIEEIYYRPALDRERGTQLELRMRIPPASTVFLTYDFEKTILRYTEYPPDANRGFDVAAAVITILDPETKARVSNLRTTTLLLSLPTPDFSMPYNVIIFTSTAIALAYGGLFNILVRRFVAADEGPEAGLGAIVKRLKGRIQGLIKGKGKAVGKAGSNGAAVVDQGAVGG